MTYKKKRAFLLALIFFLALANILGIVFDPARNQGKLFAWLDGRFADLADRIEIYGSAGGTVLVRKNNVWFFMTGSTGLPVKQERVEELFTALSRKERYLLRSASVEGIRRLGLSEGSASRIIVRGGAGLPLLDLFVGAADSLGENIYLKRGDKKEIYSGEDRFTYFTESSPSSWYDLRLFPSQNSVFDGKGNRPGIAAAALTVESVQQADVVLPEDIMAEPRSFSFRRSGGTWVFGGNEGAAVDRRKAESWIRSVLEAEAGDIISAVTMETEGSITLWLGDGTNRIILAGPEIEGRRYVKVSGSDLIYVLDGHTGSRLFRERPYFTDGESATTP